MSTLLGQPQSVEMPSRNKMYPGNSLLINATVDDSVFDADSSESNGRIDQCVQEVLGKTAAKWKKYALIGVILVKKDRSKKAFVDIDAKTIAASQSSKQFVYNVVARG